MLRSKRFWLSFSTYFPTKDKICGFILIIWKCCKILFWAWGALIFRSFHSSETITWSRTKISHVLKNFWRRLIVAWICFWWNCTRFIYDILTICWVQTLFESIRLVTHNWQSSDPLFHRLKVFVILLLLEIIFLLRNFSFTRWFQSSWIFAAGWWWSFYKSSL